MKPGTLTLLLSGAMISGLTLSACVARHENPPPDPCVGEKGEGDPCDRGGDDNVGNGTSGVGTTVGHNLPEPGPIDPFMVEGIEFLVAAQHDNGGWGGGSHSAQDIRDPHAVKTDPGSTSFAAMALIRAGNTPYSGEHKDSVLKAARYVVEVVEKAPEEGALITDIEGTQLQAKLGQVIDTSMSAQFLSRLLPLTDPDADFQARVERALDKCIRKIESAQNDDGSWTTQGWAPVLQSSMNNQALELAQVAGRKVDDDVLNRSRGYQSRDVDVDTGIVGGVKARASAGVALYAGAATQRATAKDAVEAEIAVANAKKEGKLSEDAEVTVDSLRKIGFSSQRAETMSVSWRQNAALLERLEDENYLSGFGNNGGEEFISFMMSSESLVIRGGETWTKWNDKMHTLFEKIQNQDGSWSGHHCITSPVICTSAAILCLTADRDTHVLLETSPLIRAGDDSED